MLYGAEILKVWQSASTGAWQTVASVPPLAETGAHVWLCPLAEDQYLLKLLSDTERVRAKNMVPKAKVHEFALARGWLRVLLAAYIDAAEPADIRLGIAEYGKPFAVDYPALQFNLSHSHGWVAVAVGRNAVGIDIEQIRPIPDWRNLADGLFGNITIEEIAALPVEEQSLAFLRRFTAREAYLKATGTGVSQSSVMLERSFHTVAAENHAFGPTLSLPEFAGYAGELCVLNA